MSHAPAALDPGVVLHGRFQIAHLLGRGGFGITYLAHDTERKDSCVVKELAPPGAVRTADGDLSFAVLGPAIAQRLRHQFIQEANFLSRIRARGVIPVRETWQERGTSYFAMDYVADAMSLQRVLLSEGRMDASTVLDIVYQLLETLEHVHARGLLHRDIKPSNVLLSPKGEAFLIDFGSAREWHADFAGQHTVQYTPGYAPLEQMSEQARRGPATDLYALSALAYALLTGDHPAPAVERATGTPLIPLRAIRPDVEPRVAATIEAGLALGFPERPQSASAMRAMMDGPAPEAELVSTLATLDAQIVRLQAFKFNRRECPGCGGVLEEPKPLRVGACPVCREGVLRARKIAAKLCPVCRIGILHDLPNTNPLKLCPTCRTGLLRTQGLLRKRTLTCEACGETYGLNGDHRDLQTGSPGRRKYIDVIRNSDGESHTAAEWRSLAGRTEFVRRCDGCGAQFDRQDDERYRQITPKPTVYGELFEDEWAQIAAGLEPGAGNTFCEACDADFFADAETLTLLGASKDPFGFAERHQGQLLRRDDVRWLAVGKSSGQAGLLCVGGGDDGARRTPCGTEFDGAGDVLTLVRSDLVRLHRHVGQSLTLANWHRVGQGLPKFGDEEGLLSQMGPALHDAYVAGELPFDSRDPELVWRGPAERLDAEGRSLGEGQFVLEADGLIFGSLLRKLRVPADQIESISHTDGILAPDQPAASEQRIRAFSPPEDGNRQAPGSAKEIVVERVDGDRLLFEVDPVVFSVKLESGKWETLLEARSLVARWGGGRASTRGRVDA
ncbi:MAG: serine/threonine protein kinase [Fimbriimonadaceae bacterium]|nr:serine/threonine protein kinase [Fimbriimonadaceae bacterium]